MGSSEGPASLALPLLPFPGPCLLFTPRPPLSTSGESHPHQRSQLSQNPARWAGCSPHLPAPQPSALGSRLWLQPRLQRIPRYLDIHFIA